MEREACLRAGGSRGMDVRTEARCGEEARTYPASEFSYTGFSSAGVAVSQVVKTAQSRGRTERTLLLAGALAGRSTASRDKRNAEEGLNPSLPMSHYCLLHPTHHSSRRQALMSCRWLAAVARVERTDARSSRAVVKTALTFGFLLPK
jgi:hypothetical protein